MKKKKYKLKKEVYVFIFIFIIILVAILYKPCSNIFALMRCDYSFGESYRIYNSGIAGKVLEKDYNKTIANIAGDKNYIDSNFELYYSLDYYSYDDFLSVVNKLIEKGYNSDDINYINSKNDNSLTEYLTSNYVQNISKWLEYDFFKSNNLERYLANFDGDYKGTVVKVNIGLDKPFYENSNIIKKYSVDVLANKYNKLDGSFVPDNLILLDNCSEGKNYLSKDAKDAYDEMCQASLNDGMHLSVNSSYRSYQDQEEVYNTYYSLYGQSYVDKYVATPGYSEHQTGLALDVKSKDSNTFADSREYKWMLENSYKYGFILRYPVGKKDVTGYNSEAWHFRYVGKDASKYIYENKITYDEYYIMFLDK